MKYDYVTDGITQGALAKFMECREKARLFYEGWTPKSITSKGLMYGNIIHGILEYTYDAIRKKELTKIPNKSRIKRYTSRLEKQWYKENPHPSKSLREQLEISLLIAESTLPVYFHYWWRADLREIRWRKIEQKFDIPYVTRSGYKTRIRGKKDGVFGNPSIKLFETKTKSRISENNLLDTLWFELQVNLYLWALKQIYGQIPEGVLYNIIRRTGLDQQVGESLPQYAKRVVEDIEKRPDFYFMRFNVTVTKSEMFAFEKELDAMVTDFIYWRLGKVGHYKNTGQCETKYGRCEMLPICSKGCYSQFEKRKVIYRELEDF